MKSKVLPSLSTISPEFKNVVEAFTTCVASGMATNQRAEEIARQYRFALQAASGMFAHKVNGAAMTAENSLKKCFRTNLACNADLQSVERDISYIRNVTQDLQDFGNAESFECNDTMTASELLQALGTEAHRVAKSYGIDVQIGPCALSQLNVRVNVERLIEDVKNLVVDSHRYGRDHVSIKMSAESCLYNMHGRQEDCVLIKYEDNGFGIAKEMKTKVFEAFQPKNNKGNGLGLAIFKHHMDVHNGLVHETGDDNGICFELYFPVHES